MKTKSRRTARYAATPATQSAAAHSCSLVCRCAGKLSAMDDTHYTAADRKMTQAAIARLLLRLAALQGRKDSASRRNAATAKKHFLRWAEFKAQHPRTTASAEIRKLAERWCNTSPAAIRQFLADLRRIGQPSKGFARKTQRLLA